MNTTQQAKELVEKYCNHYGINLNDLKDEYDSRILDSLNLLNQLNSVNHPRE